MAEERLIHELKRKWPGLTKRSERGPLAAIRLFCIECMGGYPGDVAKCTTEECTLHRFRFGHGVGSTNQDQNKEE